MKLRIRHIIILIISSVISFVANADMSHISSCNFSDVFDSTTDRYQYSGKEFDRMNGLDFYDFHARQYDPVFGRFTTPDPLSEKYYHLSPYAYCASNPLRYIDPTGMEINLTGIIGYDENFKTNYTDKIITDLSFITGMSLYLTAENTLSYNKDSDGNMVVYKNTKGKEIGSSKARSILSKSIDSTESVMVMHYAKSVADSENNIIGLSGEQINLFIEGANNIDSRTLGWGMTFLHELTHTNLGGNYKDIGNNERNTIDLMNSIRCEINDLGYNFGVRMQHQAYKINGNAYIPFDFNSLGCISKGITPSKEFKYIKF